MIGDPIDYLVHHGWDIVWIVLIGAILLRVAYNILRDD